MRDIGKMGKQNRIGTFPVSGLAGSLAKTVTEALDPETHPHSAVQCAIPLSRTATVQDGACIQRGCVVSSASRRGQSKHFDQRMSIGSAQHPAQPAKMARCSEQPARTPVQLRCAKDVGVLANMTFWAKRHEHRKTKSVYFP